MASAVKSRSNYYELLGLKPTASSEEVSRAFAREIGLFRPRPFGAVAEVGLAYETLRDPAKRRAYDESIGLRRDPPPPPAPPPRPYITNAIFMRPTPHYASPVPRPAPQVVEPAPQAVAPEPVAVAPQPVAPEHDAVAPEPVAPEPVAVAPEPAAPSFLIAAQLHDGDQGGPTESAFPRLMPRIAMRPSPALDDEEAPVELNRTLAIAGSLVLAVGLVGAWAGSQAGQAVEDSQPTNAVTMRVPKPTLAEAQVNAPAVATAPIANEPPPRVRAPILRRALPAIAAEPAAPTPPERTVAEQNRFARESIAQATAEQPAVADAAPAVIAASMPLSNSTVARTIQRIGYNCGKVSSTVPGEGAGVFTVTCSSGQTFQAKPLRGRYHFRRIGR